ncbi:MAG: hypothetical protein D6704_04035 [Nitrospirae bacterium]|nr:MAG: hypothetical protein D6704_04035 [Nitrospirota bacterium]
MFLEVETNPNCGESVFLRFKEMGPAKRVRQIKSYDRTPRGEWCDVVGWTDEADQPLCPAVAQPVEDSGAGVGFLVYGGIWGIRLKPADVNEPWSLDSPNQWGEPYLSLVDERDLRYDDPHADRQS